MSRLKLLSGGVLYRNSDPGFRTECAFLPNVVPLSREEVVCFYRIGSAFYSLDGKIAKLRSIDGGRTWACESVVWDPRNDRTSYSYTAPHATRMRDGSMVLIAHRREFSEPYRPQINPVTGGQLPGEIVLFRSIDNGHSWSDPERLDLPGSGVVDAPSQIIELTDGRWFLACEVWKSWDDMSPLHIKGFAVFSDDHGKNWVDRIDFPSAFNERKMFSHTRYTRMLDGRIAALQWTQDVGGQKDYDLHFTVSDATGISWSDPRPTGIMGQTSWLVDLGGGVLAATYTLRVGMEPGIMVVLSEDGGETWDLENQMMVWDAVGQEFLGVEHRPSYPGSHTNIAFGKPNAVCLPGGDIISSWWCTQACVTHTRFALLALE